MSSPRCDVVFAAIARCSGDASNQAGDVSVTTSRLQWKLTGFGVSTA
jgi:hypothetical protein